MDRKTVNERVAIVVKTIEDAARLNDIHPSQVTKKMVLEINPDITDKKLENLGGINLIKKAHFPVMTKDLPAIQKSKETKTYIAELENKLAKRDLTMETLYEAIEKNLKSVKIKSYKAKHKEPLNLQRDIVVLVTDTHLGLITDKEEVGGVNSYSWLEASRRIAYLTKQVLHYKKDKRDKIRHLHVVFGGDLIQGQIHGLMDRNSELLVNQMNGALFIFTHMLARFCEEYKSVVVHGIGGNHDTNAIRRVGGKPFNAQVHDSYANILYYSLSAVFKDTKNIQFHFPKGLYVDFMTPSVRVLCTHGSSLFSKDLGNIGTQLKTKSLGEALRRFNAGELARGKEPVRILLLEHVHSYASFMTEDGNQIVIAPSLSGVDNYAYGLTINNNNIGAILFESTPDFPIGDFRHIRLDGVDNDETLDDIIPFYSNELEWGKY